jgi:hypothetical protein
LKCFDYFCDHQPPKPAPSNYQSSGLLWRGFYFVDQDSFETRPATKSDQALVEDIKGGSIFSSSKAIVEADPDDPSVPYFNLVSLQFACRTQTLRGNFPEEAKPKKCLVTVRCETAKNHFQCKPKPQQMEYDPASYPKKTFALADTKLWEFGSAFQEVSSCTFDAGPSNALLLGNVRAQVLICDPSPKPTDPPVILPTACPV